MVKPVSLSIERHPKELDRQRILVDWVKFWLHFLAAIKTLTTPNPSLETGLAAARLLHPVDTRASVKHLGALKPPPPLPPPLLPPPPPPPPRLGGRPLLWLAAPGVANSGSRTALPPPPPPCDVFGAASVGVHSGSSADELSISVFPTLSRLSWLSSSSVRPRRRFL